MTVHTAAHGESFPRFTVFRKHSDWQPMKKNLLDIFFNSKSIFKKHPALGPVSDDRTLLRNTLSIAWPSVVEAFLIAVVGFVDTMMVSSLGDAAIAAVGLTSQPKMLSLAAFFALTPAVAALVARRKGENDRASAVRVVKLALIVTAVLCVVITVVFLIFSQDIIRIAGAESDTQTFAVEYFQIIVLGMVFNVFTMTINAAQRGAGNTKISMYTSVTSNLINIVFNYLLIGGNFGFPRLGVRGAAIATVIGTVVALVMAVASVLHPDGFVYLRLHTGGVYESRSARSMLSLYSSTFVEQLFLRVGFFVYAMIIAGLGTTSFTTHQIAMNVLTISFAFGDGLSASSVALVGRSLGERRPDLSRIYCSFCQRCGLICSISLSVIYVFFGRFIFALFSKTPQVLHDGEIIMKLMCLIVLIQIAQVIYSGCLRGSGDAKFTALVSFINISVLRPVLAYIACYTLGLGVLGAWTALLVDQTIRLLMTSARFKSGKWSGIEL